MNIEKEIKLLRDELHNHNKLYYIDDSPIISDYEFDMKLRKLKILEEKHPNFYDSNSPTQRIGGEITKNFDSIWIIGGAEIYKQFLDLDLQLAKDRVIYDVKSQLDISDKAL